MAARDPPDRQPRTPSCTVTLERLDRVRGATGKIAARGRQKRRKDDLVRSHQHHEEPAQASSEEADHKRGARRASACSAPARSDSIAPKDAWYAFGRARTTRSTGGSRRSHRSRTTSRSRRFSRLRSTAVCLCRGTMKPTLGCAKGEARARTSKYSVRIRFPFAFTCCSSARVVSRWLRGNVSGSGARVLRGQLNGEPLPTLLAAPAEHRAAPTRGHPLPEAMRSDAALVARTIGGLAHDERPRKTNENVRPVQNR